jgi:ankyrin repeat protein
VKSKTEAIAIILIAFATTLQGQSKTAAEMLARVSRTGDLKNAEAFISAGVDPNLPDQYGRTPLYYAALFNRNEMAALLLANKADPNSLASGPTSGSEFAQAPLQIAASMGNLRMASMLVDAGAQVNAKTKAGRVALHFAAIGNHLDLIRFLIERGAEVNTRDGEGISPLDEAVWRGIWKRLRFYWPKEPD